MKSTFITHEFAGELGFRSVASLRYGVVQGNLEYEDLNVTSEDGFEPELGISYTRYIITSERPFTGTLQMETQYLQNAREYVLDGQEAFPTAKFEVDGQEAFICSGRDLTKSSSSQSGKPDSNEIAIYEFSDQPIHEEWVVVTGSTLEETLWPLIPSPLDVCHDRFRPMETRSRVVCGKPKNGLVDLHKWLTKTGLLRLTWTWSFYGWEKRSEDNPLGMGIQNPGHLWGEATEKIESYFKGLAPGTQSCSFYTNIATDNKAQPSNFKEDDYAHDADGERRLERVTKGREILTETARLNMHMLDVPYFKHVLRVDGGFVDVTTITEPGNHGGLTTDSTGKDRTLASAIASRNEGFVALGNELGPIMGEQAFPNPAEGFFNPGHGRGSMYEIAGGEGCYNIHKNPSEEGEILPHYSWHVRRRIRLDEPGMFNRFFPKGWQAPLSRPDCNEWVAWAFVHGRQMGLQANSGKNPGHLSQRDLARMVVLGAFFSSITLQPCKPLSISYRATNADRWLSADAHLEAGFSLSECVVRIVLDNGTIIFVNLYRYIEIGLPELGGILLGPYGTYCANGKLRTTIATNCRTSSGDEFDAVDCQGFSMVDMYDGKTDWSPLMHVPHGKLLIRNPNGPDLTCDDRNNIVIHEKDEKDGEED